MKMIGLTAGRKYGNSEVLVRAALMAAQASSGAEIELIRLADLTIKPCIGCEKCVYERFAGREGKCILKNDHLQFLMDKLMECDALILGAPSYCSRPPGYLLMVQDRFLSVPSSYRKRLAQKPIVKGVIAVGGSDMVGVMLPILNRCPGMNMKLVDQMMVLWTSRPGQMLLNEAAIARAGQLGENVARAAAQKPEDGTYISKESNENLGSFDRSDYDLTTQLTPIQEACPVCHSDLIRLRGKTAECPMCYMKGTVEVNGGMATFVCDPVNRPSPYAGVAGRKRHDDDGILVADKLVQEKRQEISDKGRKYRSGITVIRPPEIAK